jgi:hypothetical protein
MELVARSREPLIVELDFREWPELYEGLLSESRMDVRTMEQQIIWIVKTFMEG